MKKIFKISLFKRIFLVIFICFLCVEGIHMYLDYQNDLKEKLNMIVETPIENLNSLADKMMELSPDRSLSTYSEMIFDQYKSKQIAFDFDYLAANYGNYTTYLNFRGGVNSYMMTLTSDLTLGNNQKDINIKDLDPQLLKEIDEYLYNHKEEKIIVEVDLVEEEPKTIILGEEYKIDDNGEYILAPVERDCYTVSYLKLNDWLVYGEAKDVESYYLYFYSSPELSYSLRLGGYIEEGKPIQFVTECYYFDEEVEKVKNIIQSKKGLLELDEGHRVKRYAYIDHDNVYYIFDITIEDPYPSAHGQECYQAYTYVKYPAFACTVTFVESVSTKLDVYITALFISIVASLFISYMITKRIKIIERQTKEIARNNFDIKLDDKHKDELGDLSKSINIMSANLENTIEQLNKEIEQVKNLESLRIDFINQFTHEIKTPLSIINGYSELIEITEDVNEKQKYLLLINQETEKINHLVMSMLQLSKLEAGKVELNKEDIDLEYLIVNIIDEFEVLLKKKNIKVTIDCIDRYILGDKQQLSTVIRNFISNAIKHTDTKIIITIDKGVSVYNEGNLIDEDKIKNIWYQFVTHDHKGSGLGLAICKSILDLHQYSYGVNNKEDGVEFYFKEIG